MPQLFSNNAGTTLAADLTDSATSLSVASSTAFDAITAPDFELVTIENGALREIVKVTARSGTTWTITRAQEGTTAQAWATGSAVESRLTAGTLDGMMQTEAHPDVSGLNHAGNTRGTRAVNLQSGRANVANVASGEDAVAVGYDSKASGSASTAVGRLASASLASGIAIGAESNASADMAAAVGLSAAASGMSGLALGSFALAAGDNSIALGRDTMAMGPASVAIGRYTTVYADAHIGVTGFFAIGADNWWDAAERNTASAVACFATPYCDLGAPAAWAASTLYAHGDVAVPTTGGTVQYRVWATVNETTYLHNTVTSAATEPTWPGDGGGVKLDVAGDAWWIGIDWGAGYETETIPDWLEFHPSGISFVCQSFAATTGTPTVSVGIASDPDLILAAAPVTITAAGQAYRFTLPNPCPRIASGEAILITVDSSASAGKMLGRFVVEGAFIETKSRT